ENFGLNVVVKSSKVDENYIYYYNLKGEYLKTKRNDLQQDSFLIYSNINPKFFDGWHVLSKSDTDSVAFSKVSEGGYGYIFRGKVYSKYETEQYWNIIDQYKQGMRE
ncbi:MAG: hypothetical protein MJ211_15090, partial [Bacteroidales bacterium]|nr:hypothetical protein [Bacteroidales bacterium]